MPWSKHNYQFDAQGNTRALVDTSTGQITDTFTYDAWGNEVLRTGTSKDNFTWNGRVGYFRDRDTNSYQVRRRPYRPKVGRWSSVDPIWPMDGINQRTYVLNNVSNNIDPSGLSRECKVGTGHLRNVQGAGEFRIYLGHLKGNNHRPQEGVENF